MSVTGIIGVLSALFWLGAIGGLALAGFNASRGRSPRPGVVLLIVGIVGGLLLSVLNAGLVLVQPNERAVVFQQIGGGATALRDEPLQPGLNWILPFVETAVVYDIGRQEVTMAGGAGEAGFEQTGDRGTLSGVQARSNDGQQVVVDVTVIYTTDPKKVNQVHINWRNTYENGFIVSQTRSVTRDSVANYGAEEIYSGGRVAVQSDTTDALGPKFNEEGFVLVDLLIRDVTFSTEFADAVERKQIAEQEAQRAVFLVQEQGQEAERARVEAQGLADAEAIRAEGEARAIEIRAKAEAEGLRLINQQISQNPNLIQFRYIQELGDNVELIIIPSNSPFLFDTQSLLSQSGGTSVTVPEPEPAAPEEIPEGEGQ
jgi:regulator of protease activity HflC (stomatin/prohibitin superfamily)